MVAEESPRISSSYEACLPFTYWCQVHYLAASLVCSGEIVKDWFLIFHITKHDILSLKTDTGPLWWGRRLYIYISCQTIIERLLVIMSFYLIYLFAFINETGFIVGVFVSLPLHHSFIATIFYFHIAQKPHVQDVCFWHAERTDCPVCVGMLMSHKTCKVPLLHSDIRTIGKETITQCIGIAWIPIMNFANVTGFIGCYINCILLS